MLDWHNRSIARGPKRREHPAPDDAPAAGPLFDLHLDTSIGDKRGCRAQ